MASEVIMPRVDMDMAEGKIAYWYVKNGDKVSKGQPLFDIETDKATMEVEAHADGIVQGVQSEIGVMMPVGTIVAWLLAEGESLPEQASAAQADAPQAAQQAEPVVQAAEHAPVAADTAATEATAKQAPTLAQDDAAFVLRATPLARAKARAEQIDLRQVKGSGPQGRVLASDLPATGSGSVASSDGAVLHAQWLAEGAGTPLVLLHGFGADHGSWKPFAPHIAEQVKGQAVLAVDLPNHGKSAHESTQCLGNLAARVLQTLDAQGVTDFHLMGHSLGGAVALALVQKASARVKSVTLIAPAGLGPDINGAFIDGLCRAESEAALRPWMAELVSDPKILSSSFIATAHKQLASPQKRGALRSMAQNLMPQGTQAESLRHVLEDLKVPAKVIWGTDDRIIPAHHGANLPGQIGLHVLRGVGHLPYIERPQLVAALVAQQMRH